MARLKVFQAHMGFFDSVVAAPSQKAALEAWGTRQNLFGEGLAAPTDDADAVKAAMEQPGVVLKRAAGSKARFSRDAEAPDAPPRPAKMKPAKATGGSKPAPARPKPDRSALAAAERALEDADAAHRRAQDALEQERKALQTRERELEDQFRAARRRLQVALDKARRDYVQAGGD